MERQPVLHSLALSSESHYFHSVREKLVLLIVQISTCRHLNRTIKVQRVYLSKCVDECGDGMAELKLNWRQNVSKRSIRRSLQL